MGNLVISFCRLAVRDQGPQNQASVRQGQSSSVYVLIPWLCRVLVGPMSDGWVEVG